MFADVGRGVLSFFFLLSEGSRVNGWSRSLGAELALFDRWGLVIFRMVLGFLAARLGFGFGRSKVGRWDFVIAK